MFLMSEVPLYADGGQYRRLNYPELRTLPYELAWGWGERCPLVDE